MDYDALGHQSTQPDTNITKKLNCVLYSHIQTVKYLLLLYIIPWFHIHVKICIVIEDIPIYVSKA